MSSFDVQKLSRKKENQKDETPPHFTAGLPDLHKFTWSQLSIVPVSVEIGRSVLIFFIFRFCFLHSDNVICFTIFVVVAAAVLIVNFQCKRIRSRHSTKPLHVIIIIIILELGVYRFDAASLLWPSTGQ